jgi:hypothetical protein
MSLFLLTIWCVGHEFIYAVDSIRQLSLSFQWRFQGLQDSVFSDDLWISNDIAFWQFHVSAMTLFLLSIWCVGREFIDTVDSICQLSLSFHGWFLGLQRLMNSLTLLVPYVSCHSVFRDNFLVYKDSVFADDLWISRHMVFLTIPCVSHDFILPIYLMRRSWIHWRCDSTH